MNEHDVDLGDLAFYYIYPVFETNYLALVAQRQSRYVVTTRLRVQILPRAPIICYLT